MGRHTDNPAPSTIRGRRHAALRKQGFAVYRTPLHETQLTELVRRGRLADCQVTDQAAVERALTELVAEILPAGF